MGLDSVVSVSISRKTAGVSQAGFGTPLILGPNAVAGQVRTYTSLSAMTPDFATSTDEYKMASAIFSQNPKVQKVKVARSAPRVAQVVTFTPVPVNSAAHKVTINGKEFSFTGDATATDAEVVAGLSALINADVDVNGDVTATGTTTLIITSDKAGKSFSYSAGVNMGTAVLTTANQGIAEDVTTANNLDPDWYCLLLASVDADDIMTGAEKIETMRRIMGYRTSAAAAKTNATTDIGSKLKAKSYFRSFGFYLSTATDYPEGALGGRCLPLDPGSETWAYKTLAATTVDKLTDSELSFLESKNLNYYISMAGVNVTKEGKVAGGEFIDIIRFIDWLQARTQEKIFSSIIKADKIPFTDGGIAIIENDLRSVLDQGIRVGGLVSYTITIPKAKDISTNDKAARKLTGIKFTAVAAGAIHAINISGEVTL